MRAGDIVCPFILKVIEMNVSQSPITILGCGSYGTALAISFSRNGSPTYLWGHNPDHIHHPGSGMRRTDSSGQRQQRHDEVPAEGFSNASRPGSDESRIRR